MELLVININEAANWLSIIFKSRLFLIKWWLGQLQIVHLIQVVVAHVNVKKKKQR